MTTIDHDYVVRRSRGGALRLIGYGIALILGLVVLFSLVSVTRIGAGQVGVEVNLAGSQRGPADIPVRTG